MATFVLRGLYGVYLTWFARAFDKSRFFVRRAEDLNFADPNLLESSRKLLSDLYSFAGVDRDPPGLDKEATSSARAWSSDNFAYKKRYVKLLPATRDALQAFYEPYVAKLQQTFDDPDLKWW